MSAQYNVWVHIEEVDEAEDIYEDVGEPTKVVTLQTELAAQAFVEDLLEAQGQRDELLKAAIPAAKLLVSHWSEFGLRGEEMDVLAALQNAIAKVKGGG